MIPIPDSLAITRNTAAERKMVDAARTWITKADRTEGIHASDLLNPLQAWWKRKDPQPLTDRNVALFLVGKVLHAFVLGTMAGATPDLGTTDEGSRWSEELGLWYSLDWDKSDIAEFKSARFFKEPKTVSDLQSYIEQVLIYMAARKRCSAQLWVLLLNFKNEQGKTSPAFRAYTISISEDDLVSLQRVVREHVQLLEGALKSGDTSALPLCKEYICGSENCPWWNKCKPTGRYGVWPESNTVQPVLTTEVFKTSQV